MAIIICLFLFLFPLIAHADTHYVCGNGATCGSGWTTGNDSNACTAKDAPCLTVNGGIGKLTGGDTLTIGDGTYTETMATIPAGSSGAYTVIQSENVHGVTMVGAVSNPNAYIQIDGLKINANGADSAITITSTDHVKLTRLAAFGTTDAYNNVVVSIQQSTDCLVEECWAWGAGRYKFQAYWSTRVVFRRNVARHDYKGIAGLQCALFNNYDSDYTIWQNNIAIDSTTGNCNGGLYGAWYSEIKNDRPPGNVPTPQTYYGNIALNVINGISSAGIYDKTTGTHSIENMILYGSNGGFLSEWGGGDAAYVAMNHVTIGGLVGTYNGMNGYDAGGTSLGSGVNVQGDEIPRTNYLSKNGIYFDNNSCGIADYAVTDYSVYYNNTAGNVACHNITDYYSDPDPELGAHDTTDQNPLINGLLYLPRIEAGSYLKTAGEGGTQIGAEVMYKMGVSSTLYGETGWNTLTSDPLWPFPNEAFIKADMASYSGDGGLGTRGFCTNGLQLNGVDTVTLTSYIWEYLGNQMPTDIYGTTPQSLSGVTSFAGCTLQ